MTHPLLITPPLVEIVAEVRWGGAITGSPTTFVELDDTKFVSFGIAVGKAGYNQLERVLPSGFPAPAGTVVYRYRKADESQHTLYQLGSGLFTANGLPPYDSWARFRSAVKDGIDAALTVGAIPQGVPVQLMLRYIDAFAGAGLVGRTPLALMKEMLGLNFQPPEVVKAEGDPVSARLSIEYPCLADGLFSIEIGQGKKAEEDALIMNTVASSREEHVDPAKVMSKFDELQSVLHDAFLELIKRVAV